MTSGNMSGLNLAPRRDASPPTGASVSRHPTTAQANSRSGLAVKSVPKSIPKTTTSRRITAPASKSDRKQRELKQGRRKATAPITAKSIAPQRAVKTVVTRHEALKEAYTDFRSTRESVGTSYLSRPILPKRATQLRFTKRAWDVVWSSTQVSLKAAKPSQYSGHDYHESSSSQLSSISSEGDEDETYQLPEGDSISAYTRQPTQPPRKLPSPPSPSLSSPAPAPSLAASPSLPSTAFPVKEEEEEIDQLADDEDLAFLLRPPPTPQLPSRERKSSVPLELISAFENMSVSALRLRSVGRIPFLSRNLRTGFEASVKRLSGAAIVGRTPGPAYNMHNMLNEEGNIQTSRRERSLIVTLHQLEVHRQAGQSVFRLPYNCKCELQIEIVPPIQSRERTRRHTIAEYQLTLPPLASQITVFAPPMPFESPPLTGTHSASDTPQIYIPPGSQAIVVVRLLDPKDASGKSARFGPLRVTRAEGRCQIVGRDGAFLEDETRTLHFMSFISGETEELVPTGVTARVSLAWVFRSSAPVRPFRPGRLAQSTSASTHIVKVKYGLVGHAPYVESQNGWCCPGCFYFGAFSAPEYLQRHVEVDHRGEFEIKFMEDEDDTILVRVVSEIDEPRLPTAPPRSVSPEIYPSSEDQESEVPETPSPPKTPQRWSPLIRIKDSPGSDKLDLSDSGSPRYPVLPPAIDQVGPAVRAEDIKSSRRILPCLGDLLSELPMEPFGCIAWSVISAEEAILDLSDVMEPDKVMLCLWNRWSILHRCAIYAYAFRSRLTARIKSHLYC
ncbi:hypothetical protein BOTBODRAFT_65309 [Botryobasidium botryosum FD-172 SS1]|uniref:Uncharacterized protein n=1 Tax=Botryobasidium botryosum (strain FD-172 SS1) TaxID=930990 RepID=A0A067MIK1_BOTB1|nr:hypothetical protein BOTBODRAFT_65309 [Botryobasidium botryosum FD-172 SS1]